MHMPARAKAQYSRYNGRKPLSPLGWHCRKLTQSVLNLYPVLHSPDPRMFWPAAPNSTRQQTPFASCSFCMLSKVCSAKGTLHERAHPTFQTQVAQPAKQQVRNNDVKGRRTRPRFCSTGSPIASHIAEHLCRPQRTPLHSADCRLSTPRRQYPCKRRDDQRLLAQVLCSQPQEVLKIGALQV